MTNITSSRLGTSEPDITNGHESSDPDTGIETFATAKMQKSLVREILVVGTLCTAQLMTQAGLALAVAPLHIIGSSFDVSSPGQLSWYASSYSLTVGTFILLAGRLGDDFGHKVIFVFGFLWFGVWSLVSGFAVWSDQIFFDCCRALQGIGPALLLPNAIATLGCLYPPGRRKDMVFSLFGATAPGGFTIGAVIASLISEKLWWPWAYWIMGITCLMLSVLATIVLPRSSNTTRADSQLSWFTRLDIPGAITGISGLILVNFAWNQGPVVGWTVPYNYVLLIVGFILLGLFAFIELRAQRPLLPRSLFTKDLGWVLGCVGAGWSSFGILVFYFFQFMEVVKGDTPLLASAKWSGTSVSGAIAAVTTGYIIAHLRPSVIMLLAMVAFAVGQILLATLPVEQIYWAQAFVITIVTPWGM